MDDDYEPTEDDLAAWRDAMVPDIRKLRCTIHVATRMLGPICRACRGTFQRGDDYYSIAQVIDHAFDWFYVHWRCHLAGTYAG